MAIIQPPAPLPLRGVKWRLQTPTQINRSGWTGTRKVIGLPGAAIWTATGEFIVQMGEDRARPWRAFFAALRGSENCFPLLASERQQTDLGNATIAGGANPNAGNALILQSLPESITALGAGNLITFPLPSGHQRLVCLTDDLVVDNTGRAMAHFEPELGEVPFGDIHVEMRRPFALMALTSDPPGWDVDVGQMYSFSFSAEEAR